MYSIKGGRLVYGYEKSKLVGGYSEDIDKNHANMKYRNKNVATSLFFLHLNRVDFQFKSMSMKFDLEYKDYLMFN